MPLLGRYPETASYNCASDPMGHYGLSRHPSAPTACRKGKATITHNHQRDPS
ncbi:hypothetical protein Pcar_3239 [Syntrophotalea carbinolica DSM 2380]|uniref:Uncharacterized protein n=1 Tax=Syntrophotalea carbinolica (strain DSM 2380 / NBRC 103641 / GraBd1) TaxID=338963 RepID=Q0C6S8_SYNC1|nr:hypothetical protein Pcar_3239 [Syntrophotalea carbinolica DSM 2380]